MAKFSLQAKMHVSGPDSQSQSQNILYITNSHVSTWLYTSINVNKFNNAFTP